MMIKKLVLIPALLVSAYGFAHVPEATVEEAPEMRAQVMPLEHIELEQTTPQQSDIMQAFALNELLKDNTMKIVYESLDTEQQSRFADMMVELSMIMEEAASKTEVLMAKNKDIQDVWRVVSKGQTRFVLTAAFETCSEEANLAQN